MYIAGCAEAAAAAPIVRKRIKKLRDMIKNERMICTKTQKERTLSMDSNVYQFKESQSRKEEIKEIILPP